MQTKRINERFLRSHVSTTYLLPSSYPYRSTLLVCNNLPRWSFYVDIKIVERKGEEARTLKPRIKMIPLRKRTKSVGREMRERKIFPMTYSPRISTRLSKNAPWRRAPTSLLHHDLRAKKKNGLFRGWRGKKGGGCIEDEGKRGKPPRFQ